METFLQHWGYLALIVLCFVQACSIPISSEVTFAFAGVLAYQHHLELALVIIIGSLAELAGSSVSYAVGRIGGRRTVERLARYVLVTKSDLDRVERFFAGRGSWSVAVGRMLPVVRGFVGIVAGFIEIPVGPFEVYNVIGTVIWATALSVIGYGLGSAWSTVSHYVSIGGYIIVALIIVAVAALILHRGREFRRERAAGILPADLPADPAAGAAAAADQQYPAGPRLQGDGPAAYGDGCAPEGAAPEPTPTVPARTRPGGHRRTRED
jgi:membrane protein DedA with SNARE-associated domain